MATTSIKKVAEHAGVSVGTVSNVLNRPDVVAPATRKRVQAAIDELGFTRNESARQLRAGRSRTIGLVVLDVANPFFTDVAHGAEAVAESHGSVIMLCNSGDDSDREQRQLNHLEEQRVQGVLITPVVGDNGRVQRLIDHGIPTVLVDRRSGHGTCCSVAVDDVEGGYLAGRHLLEQGHDRIVFVGGPMSIRQVSDRHEGVTAAVADHGNADINLTMIDAPTLTVASGRQAGEQIAAMPADERPTAIFCTNDLMALGVLQVMTMQNLRVPDDLAIIGYDDIDFAAAAAVPLSSVRQPREQLGRSAAELLLEEINEPERHSHRQVVFKPELVVRASTATTRHQIDAAKAG
jgi:LacI family transcriptional regulator